ncbi:DUF2637 domain-containing protein [Gulosibacter chungangensis]|uniref:DUF2637 domain-containing protein n=1 Tax=Gulosibacter chungangensis TaxID=979746 RepID=A0A7J5B8A3_9MICO|nr:DUF2637 domain-containing protein [Gulosibacter chungangensis]KAB1641399.1 DUF2637 domain-containing protein [Gulosibacter chungangensis]
MTAVVQRQQPSGRWAVGVARAGTALIDVCAFWLSATTLTDLARRAGIDPVQAWMWPVIVDGMIVVATVAIVALARHGPRATVYPWALLISGAAVSVTANCMHALVATDSDLPPILAASVAAVPPLVLLAATHLTVQLGRRLTTAPSPITHDHPVPPTGAGALSIESTSKVEPPVNASVAVSADARGARTDHPVSAAAAMTPSASDPGADPPVATAPATDHESPETTTSARVAPADATRPGGGSGSDARDQAVEQAIRWSREGISNRTIASRLGVHPSTVGRWFATAPDPAEEQHPDPDPPDPTQEEP